MFERKNGLEELLKSINFDKSEKSESLYNKIVEDTGAVTIQIQNWWNEKSAAYNWKGVQGGQWNIDFETGDIYLEVMQPALQN